MKLFSTKWLTTAVAILIAPMFASAAVTLNIGSTSLPVSGSTQNFVLDLTFTNDGAGVPLNGYDVALQISPSSGLTITGVGIDANKVPNPVLSNNPTYGTASGPLYLFSDVQASAGSIDNGDGLFRVLLQAAPNTAGTFTISFFQDESSIYDTKLNQLANEVPGVIFNSGTVTFVPEPAALGLAMLGLPLILRRRR